MQRIGFVVFPGFQVMNFAAVSVFEIANAVHSEPIYDVRVLSETGGGVVSSIGMSVETTAISEMSFDTLIVSGGVDIVPSSPGLLAMLRRALGTSRRVAAICTGAFILAEAGLLNGRRATTHWAYGRTLQARYPTVRVDEDRIFIIDGSVWTSAGMTAGIDLALAMVEKDLGTDVSQAIAKKLVIHHRRAGGQSQYSAMLKLEPKSDRIQKALAYAESNLSSDLNVDDLARAANLSPRQFSRAFRAETGQSPAKAIETLRVEAARLMMEQSRSPIEAVAQETGFADRERMRRAFLRAYGQPPQVMRRNAQAAM